MEPLFTITSDFAGPGNCRRWHVYVGPELQSIVYGILKAMHPLETIKVD